MECICQRPEFRSVAANGYWSVIREEDTDTDLQYYSNTGCNTVSDGYPEVTNFKLYGSEIKCRNHNIRTSCYIKRSKFYKG
jgi:hypothetical protein